MNKYHHLPSSIAICATALLFVILGAFYETAIVRHFDLLLMKSIASVQAPALDTVFILISDSASRPAEFFLLALFSVWCVLYKQRIAEPLLLTAALLGVRHLNSWLKEWFERGRPAFQQIIEAPGYSFPSGHAMISCAFYLLLVIVLMKLVDTSQHIRRIAIAITAVFVFLVGLSRVYLGVHYPSDVLAGFMAGIFWLFLFLFVYKRIEN